MRFTKKNSNKLEITKEILDRVYHYLRLGYVAFK